MHATITTSSSSQHSPPISQPGCFRRTARPAPSHRALADAAAAAAAAAAADAASYANASPEHVAVHEILVSTGLAQLYPQVAQFFGSAHFDYTSRGQSTVMEVYDHLSALNQLLVIAQQLQDDMHARRFKYAAHKLALLYQAVNLSKLRRQELRDRIEQRFDEVKSATDGAGSFSLSLIHI